MRPQLIALALTSGILASTNTAQRDTPTRSKDSLLQPRHGSGLALGVVTLHRRTWASRPRLRRWWGWGRGEDSNCDGDGDGTDCEEDDKNKCKTSTHISSSTSLITSNTQGISSPTPSSTTTIIVPNSALDTPIATVIVTLPPSSANTPAPQDIPIHKDENDGNEKLIAVGVVAGLLFLFVLMLAYYWLVIRPRRRGRLSEQNLPLSKDADLESHVTVDLRNGVHTPPHDPNSSSDGISSFALSAVSGSPGTGHRAVMESADRGLSMPPSPPLPHAGVYPALQRGPMASSPAVSHPSAAAAAYAAPRAAYSQTHLPQTDSPTGSLRALVFPPANHPPPLHIGAAHMASSAPPPPVPPMELDSRPPPPRYPDAIATSGLSPTSPLPVSPLSVTSPHETAAAAAAAALAAHNTTTTSSAASVEESPRHHGGQQQHQRYEGAPQPSYEGYEPSALPEVVSPICQLGQTSASLPEYDESAEAIARSSGGINSSSHHDNNSFINHHFPHFRHEGEEKQVLQQSMSRY
ncbi:hypothetical protein F5Y09DRAFT_336355 [Xylaria sp. FL1042]|nr:hypothetical protein F5Y09DRAFT_336355 [Xylaria sp. FL1042]